MGYMYILDILNIIDIRDMIFWGRLYSWVMVKLGKIIIV